MNDNLFLRLEHAFPCFGYIEETFRTIKLYNSETKQGYRINKILKFVANDPQGDFILLEKFPTYVKMTYTKTAWEIKHNHFLNNTN